MFTIVTNIFWHGSLLVDIKQMTITYVC